jgi:hypothetical protein
MKERKDFNRFSQNSTIHSHASRPQLQSSRLDRPVKHLAKQYQVTRTLDYHKAIRSIMCNHQTMLAKQRPQTFSIRAENGNYVGGNSRLGW